MIQRVQTVFLALLAIAMVVMVFMPIWVKESAELGDSIVLDTMGMIYYDGSEIKEQTNTMYIAALALVISIIAVASIFSYKTRMKQIRLNLLNAFLLFILAGINAYWIFYEGKSLFDPNDIGQLGIGFYLPLVALILNSLANRFIMRDERLVKSVDRLR